MSEIGSEPLARTQRYAWSRVPHTNTIPPASGPSWKPIHQTNPPPSITQPSLLTLLGYSSHLTPHASTPTARKVRRVLSRICPLDQSFSPFSRAIWESGNSCAAGLNGLIIHHLKHLGYFGLQCLLPPLRHSSNMEVLHYQPGPETLQTSRLETGMSLHSHSMSLS